MTHKHIKEEQLEAADVRVGDATVLKLGVGACLEMMGYHRSEIQEFMDEVTTPPIKADEAMDKLARLRIGGFLPIDVSRRAGGWDMRWAGGENDPPVEIVNAALMTRLMELLGTPAKGNEPQWIGGAKIAAEQRGTIHRLARDMRIDPQPATLH